jgi:hypothetical protein
MVRAIPMSPHGDVGLELRVEHRSNPIDSRLSRVNKAPVLVIADEVKADLMQGAANQLISVLGLRTELRQRAQKRGGSGI